jgi:hypothetical protein
MNQQNWQLKRTQQCSQCPWKINRDPHSIPGGYSREKHFDLSSTIAQDSNIPVSYTHLTLPTT